MATKSSVKELVIRVYLDKEETQYTDYTFNSSTSGLGSGTFSQSFPERRKPGNSSDMHRESEGYRESGSYDCTVDYDDNTKVMVRIGMGKKVRVTLKQEGSGDGKFQQIFRAIMTGTLNIPSGAATVDLTLTITGEISESVQN